MPAKSLSISKELAHAFCVVGAYCNSKDKYVRHVGLLSPSRNGSTATTKLSYGQAVSLDHVVIQDPKSLSAALTVNHDAKARGVSAHVVGWLNGPLKDELSPKEKGQIEAFITENKLVRFDYLCHPPYFETDHKSSEGHAIRMSCVGLVIRVYKLIGTPLLEEDYSHYPPIDKVELGSVYPIIINMPDAQMRSIGLDPPGPWRIVLPGYLFHAFKQVPKPFMPTSKKLMEF
jgi:hypothetical protein